MTEYGLNVGHVLVFFVLFLIWQILINWCCNDVSVWYVSNSIFNNPDFSAANDGAVIGLTVLAAVPQIALQLFSWPRTWWYAIRRSGSAPSSAVCNFPQQPCKAYPMADYVGRLPICQVWFSYWFYFECWFCSRSERSINTVLHKYGRPVAKYHL